EETDSDAAESPRWRRCRAAASDPWEGSDYTLRMKHAPIAAPAPAVGLVVPAQPAQHPVSLDDLPSIDDRRKNRHEEVFEGDFRLAHIRSVNVASGDAKEFTHDETLTVGGARKSTEQ